MIESRKKDTRQHVWDTLGMSLAGASLLQSLLVPVVLSIWPLGARAESLYAGAYPAPVLVLGPVALIALYRGYGRHRQGLIAGLMGLGLVLLLAVPLEGLLLGARGEVLGVLLGSSLLMEGHWRNRRALCLHHERGPDKRGTACPDTRDSVHQWVSGYGKGTAGDTCW